MAIGLRIPLQQPPPEPRKYGRDVFLYMDPLGKKEAFAQCGSCKWWTGPQTQRCAILGKALKVGAADSCNLYVYGTPNADQPIEQATTPEIAGFVNREVRCRNCRSFNEGMGTCGLYQQLNDTMPDAFDLDEQVDPNGCCSANKPKSQDKQAPTRSPLAAPQLP